MSKQTYQKIIMQKYNKKLTCNPDIAITATIK